MQTVQARAAQAAYRSHPRNYLEIISRRHRQLYGFCSSIAVEFLDFKDSYMVLSPCNPAYAPDCPPAHRERELRLDRYESRKLSPIRKFETPTCLQLS